MRISGLLLALAALACHDAAAPVPAGGWRPGTIYPAPGAPRGLIDARGLIHAHSVYSHDACDGEPVKNGARDAVCFDNFRRGLCRSLHDFVMLTDHPSDFGATPFPEALLYRPESGDVLVSRGGSDVANRLHCDDGRSALVLAGAESRDVMPVGLERHVDAADREVAYGDRSEAGTALVQSVGGLVLVPHTEGASADALASPAVHGFEMFNLHASATRNIADALQMIVLHDAGGAGLPVPDAVLVPMLDEDPRYLSRWGDVLSRGVRRVTTMGTDCHENTFPSLLEDGERIDSYRRTMIAFSNHLLVQPEADGTWDDRHLKDALRAGRVYGAFEALGYPEGFDFRAETADAVHALGAEVPLASLPRLRVTAPIVRDLDPRVPAPERRVRLLRAVAGGWEEVAAGAGDLDFTPTVAGAYRAQVDLVPHHLAPYLGEFAESVASTWSVWIYGNAIYIR